MLYEYYLGLFSVACEKYCLVADFNPIIIIVF